MNELLTVGDLGKELGGISTRSIYTRICRGRLPRPIKIGGRCYWRRKDWDAWIDQQARQQGVVVDVDMGDTGEEPPPQPKRRGPGRPRKEVKQ